MNDQFHFQADNFPTEPTGHAKGYGITALVLGICAVFFTTCCCCCYYVSVFCGVGAIVFAILSRRDNGGSFGGMALAGLILGIIGVILFGAMIAVEIGFNSTDDSQAFRILNDFYKEKFGVDLEEIIRQEGFDSIEQLIEQSK